MSTDFDSISAMVTTFAYSKPQPDTCIIDYTDSMSVTGMSIGGGSGYMSFYQYLKTYYPNKLTDSDSFMFDEFLAKKYPEIFQEYRQAEAVYNL